MKHDVSAMAAVEIQSPWTIRSSLLLAALGPPSKVALSPEGRNLDIVISDPLSSTNRSMREHHEDLYFQIRYWERSADGQVGAHLTPLRQIVGPTRLYLFVIPK